MDSVERLVVPANGDDTPLRSAILIYEVCTSYMYAVIWQTLVIVSPRRSVSSACT